MEIIKKAKDFIMIKIDGAKEFTIAESKCNTTGNTTLWIKAHNDKIIITPQGSNSIKIDCDSMVY